MDEMRNEHQQYHHFNHNQPNRMTPAQLQSLLTHIGNMYPTMFIVSFALHYNSDANITNVAITCNGEKYPNQFAMPLPSIPPYNAKR